MLRRPGLCLVFCVILISRRAVPASAQVLSYSTYIANNAQTGSTAANRVGEECVFEGTSVIKLDGNGSILYSVPFSTLPGVLTGAGRAVIDSQGNCYVASGGTINPTPGAFQSSPKLLAPAQFVMKFDPAGKTLYATYLGGSSTDSPAGLAVDSDGNAYITGATNSNDFPTLHAVQPVLAGQEDVFIAVLNPTPISRAPLRPPISPRFRRCKVHWREASSMHL